MTHHGSHDHHGHSHHHHPDGSGQRRRWHPAWWVVLGVLLTLLAILGWTWPEMFGVPVDPTAE